MNVLRVRDNVNTDRGSISMIQRVCPNQCVAFTIITNFSSFFRFGNLTTSSYSPSAFNLPPSVLNSIWCLSSEIPNSLRNLSMTSSSVTDPNVPVVPGTTARSNSRGSWSARSWTSNWSACSRWCCITSQACRWTKRFGGRTQVNTCGFKHAGEICVL